MCKLMHMHAWSAWKVLCGCVRAGKLPSEVYDGLACGEMNGRTNPPQYARRGLSTPKLVRNARDARPGAT